MMLRVVGAGHADVSCLCFGAPRIVDAVDYHEYGPKMADELQSGCGWHSKGQIVGK